MLEYLLLLFLMIPFAAVGFSRFPVGDRKYLWGGFFAHAAGALAQWAIIFGYYGGGDSSGYMWYAKTLGRMVRATPTFLFDVLKLAMNSPTMATEWVIGAGTSTGAMAGVATLLGLVLNESIPAILLAASLCAFAGQLGIYIAVREAMSVTYRSRIAVACFYVPSLVFWTSGLLKESFALGGLGVVIWAGARLVKRAFTPQNWAVFFAGAWFLGLFKPYALVPTTVALLVWFFAKRAAANGRPVLFRPHLVIASAIASVAAVLLLGQVFPQLAYDAALEETSRLQDAYRNIEAGSTYELGGEESKSLTQQVTSLPLALASALFRPFLFEAHNFVALMNALETTALLLAVVYLFWSQGPRRLARLALSDPFVLFSLVFVLLFAAVVGLASQNLGTLSRYRTLMFPIYVSLILIVLPLRNRTRPPR